MSDSLTIWGTDYTGVTGFKAGAQLDGPAGKNLYNPATKTDGYYLTSSGSLYPDNTCSISDYIAVIPGENYVWSGISGKTGTNNKRVVGYSEKAMTSPQVIQAVSVSGIDIPYENSFVVPSGIYFIKLSYNTADGEMMVEHGTTKTNYEPYTNIITYAYVRPQGTKSITENGNNIDVTEFATVNVDVPAGIISHNLPSSYQEVRYITGQESGAAIDTGIQPDETTYAELKVAPLAVTGDVLLGTKGANDNSDWRLFNHSSIVYWDVWSSRTYGTPFVVNTIRELRVENFKVTDMETGVTLISGTTVSDFDVPYDIFINGGSPTMTTQATWHYVTIYKGGTKVREFIPCYRKSDDVVGMYDLVSSTFFASAGSGAFTAGPDIPSSGGGGNDFIITVSKNAQTGYWEPDCTWADVLDAYTAGKNITVNTDDVDNVQADGALRVVSGQLNDFHYVVNELFDAGQSEDWAVLQGVYQLDSNGLVRNDTFTYYDTYPANFAASDLASGKIAYGQNGRIVGTYVPPAGTAGTPTATKGTVSNHSISVTPSVTNTAGMISGGTITGTAVTVTASELASGNKEISSNGTNIDVVGYETVSVAVPENTLVITVLKNAQTQQWQPDCTYAQVLAAYNAGKTIVMKADNSACADCYIYVDPQEGLVIPYTVEELLDDGQGTDYWIEQRNYIWTSSGAVQSDLYDYWDTTPADAVASDVASGKVFYNSTGRVVGTSQGGGVIVTETTDEHGGTVVTITSGTTVTLQSKSVTPTSSSQTILPDTGYNGMSEVIVAAVPGPNLQTKSITPSESSQTVTPDQGYDGFSSVYVGPISTNYVGSNIPRRTSSDLTTSGPGVSVPAGYYANGAAKAVSYGSVGTPVATKSAVQNNSLTVTPRVQVLQGYVSSANKTGTAVTVTAAELESGTKSITSNGTGIDVTGYAAVDVAVPSGSPNLQNKTVSYTPTESAQSDTVSADSGYDGLDEVTVNVGAISSSYVGSGITRRSSSDVTGGQTAGQYSVSVPSGYYANNVTHDVPQGSVGTPTAAKGAVSNHSVSVTPSVAYTGGYIYSSSKTGTAVTVTASELVSGSETKTINGTYDVTNLASLVVSIPIVTYYTGSSAPSSSLGSNGDIYLQTS